jgi:hypothetical protein
MIRDLCLEGKFVCIHCITPEGGAGKSKFNSVDIDLYDRFKFNFIQKKGLATSTYSDVHPKPKMFGSQGIIIYDGQINNVNRMDGGSCFNDESGLWETPEGIQSPSIPQARAEIMNSIGTYIEMNIYAFTICGLFLDLTELSWTKRCIRSLSTFYSETEQFKLPYYGFTIGGIIRINEQHLLNNDWMRVSGGTLVSITEVYSVSSVVV